MGRRAVYLPILRNRLHEMLAVFDFPDPNLSIGRRTTSTLSTQALYLMNSPLVLDQATAAARRLLDEKQPDGTRWDDESRLSLLYVRALGRAPNDVERKLAMEYVLAPGGGDDEARLRRWSGLCQAVMSCIDFRYID